VTVASRWPAAARRAGRRLLGGYALRPEIGSAVSGAWLWRVVRVCSVPWHTDCTREIASGRASSRVEAIAATLDFECNPRVTLERGRHVFGEQALHSWPREQSLWVQAAQLQLPEHLRGLGRVIAADASRRDSDRHAGWGVVSDAGWYQHGRVDYATAHVSGLEALAIGRALQFYPRGHLVDVLSDNLDAAHIARRILAGRLTRWEDAPSWLPHDAFTALHKAAGRQLRARVIEVRSKTHALHNIADRLARYRDTADLLQPKEDA
jgi:hypothetical protein